MSYGKTSLQGNTQEALTQNLLNERQTLLPRDGSMEVTFLEVSLIKPHCEILLVLIKNTNNSGRSQIC